MKWRQAETARRARSTCGHSDAVGGRLGGRFPASLQATCPGPYIVKVKLLTAASISVPMHPKGQHDLAGSREFPGGIRTLCTVLDLTAEIHEGGLVLGERYGFLVYDAVIVSAG